jgi:sigma-B regulation protein RsbU (phosphoserine phosphatase)
MLLLIISGILSQAPLAQPSLPAYVIVSSFVLNIGGVSAIAFFLLKYFVHAREQAMMDLKREHLRVRHSLTLAMEVQQNLLPRKNPWIPGLDIAGTSIYCDETGGDYYDYLQAGDNSEEKLGVVVGDVSEHGIPSALLMATVRAQIRQRYFQCATIEQVICDVNRQLTRDVQDSARFMTLFMAELDRKSGQFVWLNAGHEPAIVYTPESNAFEELAGGGSLPLGITEDFKYKANRLNIMPGQILAIATDGIFETHNSEGQMFGRRRFYDIIRRNASKSAEQIMDATLEAVNKFRKNLPPEDDLTLVIIKILL